MAWKFPVSTNTKVDLGANDDVFVAANVLVGVVGDSAISGLGKAHEVEILGTVISTSDTIALAPAENQAVTNSVTIADGAYVISKESVYASAVMSMGAGALIDNDGDIIARGNGIWLQSSGVKGTNTIVNHGSITADFSGVVAMGDAKATEILTNYGTIKGGEYSYGQADPSGSAIDKIVNRGTMIGDIYLDAGNDLYDGRSGALKGIVEAADGNDRILGGKENNTFFGGDGDDTLSGGRGADNLTGGGDADTFVFKSISESTVAVSGRDTLLDFSHDEHDKIDLHAIDANTRKTGNQDFTFIGNQAFHHQAGELRYEKSAGDIFVFGDANGDGKADFAIKLEGTSNLVDSDFSL